MRSCELTSIELKAMLPVQLRFHCRLRCFAVNHPSLTHGAINDETLLKIFTSESLAEVLLKSACQHVIPDLFGTADSILELSFLI